MTDVVVPEGQMLVSVEDVNELSRLRTMHAIKASQAIAGRDMPGTAPEVTARALDRLQRMRIALRGMGRVSTDVDSEGRPLGDQIRIVLGPHEAETLMMELFRSVRFEADIEALTVGGDGETGQHDDKP